MLFMVIERFKNGDIDPVGERFRASGRMMPDDVKYISSWIDFPGAVCYQMMEADSADRLKLWTDNWCDLVDFEVVPVLTSADFWAQRSGDQPTT